MRKCCILLWAAAILRLWAQAPPPPPPAWQFSGTKEDYARIARLNGGIVRHIGKRLPTGFQREFSEDFNNTAILFLAYRDKAAFDRYAAALGYLASTRWGIDRTGGYDYNCDGATITEILVSYELMREHLPAALQKQVEDWLDEWARVRADESIMKRPDWKWDQRTNQQNYGGALAAVSRILAGKYDTAPLLKWINGQHSFHTFWSGRKPMMLGNALGWDAKSRPGDESITQYSNWDALNLWEISRAKGIDPAKLQNTRKYFEFFLLMTAPNGARARFGHDYQRDSVAAVFAMAAHLLKDGRYKYALNRVVDFSLEKKYRFPLLDLAWRLADDNLQPVEPKRKSAYISTPWTDYIATGKEMPDKIVFRDGWDPADDAFLFIDLRHSGQHSLPDANMLGSYIWRDVPWLTNTSERALHTKDIDYRWQANTMVIRPGTGGRPHEYLKHRESDRASADVQPSDVLFHEFGDAAFSRSTTHAAGFEQTRAVWHLGRGYTVVFDNARAEAPGTYTIGTVWHTSQEARLKTDDALLLEDRLENRFTLQWFPGQPVESALEKRRYIGAPEASGYYGQGKDVADLFQAGAGEFKAGDRWTNINLLLPHRKPGSTAARISGSAIEVRRADTVDLIAVADGTGNFGRVATNAAAVLAQWSRKWAGPVRVRYVEGDRLDVETGIEPEAVVLRRFGQNPWYVDTTPQSSEKVLARNEWRFAAGRVEMKLPGGSGEVEIRFPQSARRVLNLNRDWKLLPWDAPKASEPGFDDSGWRDAQFPHSEQARAAGPNVHWYRKQFTLGAEAAGKQAFLDFEGVAIQCDVWVNGRKAGDHLGAFNSFRLDVTSLLNAPGKNNVVAVRVDFSPKWRYKIPFLPEGHNDYGGIYRDVWLTLTDPLHVADVFVTTPEVSAESAAVKVAATLANRGPRPRSVQVVSVVYDDAQREVLRAESALDAAAASTSEVVLTTPPLKRPRLWSPASPTLYTVLTRILEQGRVIDEVRRPLGFRWFRFDRDKGFFLNGEHLKLHGANMHQGYPYAGNAVPNSKMAFDLHVLKAMGCNFLRTTHITMDPVVLEMADRLGLLLWEEIPVAGFGNGRMGEPLYDESARHQMREMIRRDRNHPSVILWSTMNEAAGGESRKRLPATLKLCRELHEIARQEDPTRLTAIAETVDAFFAITDVSGRNGYFRGSNLYELGGVLDRIRRENPEARVLITEYGAPNVERGAFGQGRSDTEEYAALVHEHNTREYERRPWIAGATIWNAFDYFEGAPHEGVADEARYPKDAYYYYDSQWSGRPMLRIRSSAHWNFGPEAADRRYPPAYDVVVDTNCDSVELFVNGRSQGVQTGPGPLAWKQLSYAPGEIRAVGRKGAAVLEHSRLTAAEPHRVVLSADVSELAADGADLGYLQARIVDAEGRLVPSAYGPVQFSVEGEGVLLGPATQNARAGIATLASVRAGTREGEIRIKARYGRLKPAELVLRTTSRRSSVEFE